jgi:hypothetical protein
LRFFYFFASGFFLKKNAKQIQLHFHIGGHHIERAAGKPCMLGFGDAAPQPIDFTALQSLAARCGWFRDWSRPELAGESKTTSPEVAFPAASDTASNSGSAGMQGVKSSPAISFGASGSNAQKKFLAGCAGGESGAWRVATLPARGLSRQAANGSRFGSVNIFRFADDRVDYLIFKLPSAITAQSTPKI